MPNIKKQNIKTETKAESKIDATKPTATKPKAKAKATRPTATKPKSKTLAKPTAKLALDAKPKRETLAKPTAKLALDAKPKRETLAKPTAKLALDAKPKRETLAEPTAKLALDTKPKRETLAEPTAKLALDAKPKRETLAKPDAKPKTETKVQDNKPQAKENKQQAKENKPEATTPQTKSEIKPAPKINQRKKVLFVASECTPFVKTGGLADVVGTLPSELSANGLDVRVILPMYRDIPMHWQEQFTDLLHFYVNLGWRSQYCGIKYFEHGGITYYFVDNEFYFGRDDIYGSGPEEGERFAFFCRAVLETIQNIGFQPDIIHCHDWQSGMIPLLLNTQYKHIKLYSEIKTVYTIHNLRYQGVFDWDMISALLGIEDKYFTSDMLEYFGCASFMKAGIVFADKISTVSPTYAQEIQTHFFGESLDGVIRSRSNDLVGILNGINNLEYDPRTDMYINNHFSKEDTSNKLSNKIDMQNMLGLDVRADVPIVSIISRLTDQKGIDLIKCILDDMMRSDMQLIVLGMGEEHYQDFFAWAAWRYQGRIATRIELNNPLSHQIYAASDLMLIPSQFEPCGLTQMIAMRYGTIPVVRETGGLKDSVIPYNKFTGEGNGFSFANYNAHELLYTLQEAVSLYSNEEIWSGLMQSAFESDFSWKKSAVKYIELYDSLE